MTVAPQRYSADTMRSNPATAVLASLLLASALAACGGGSSSGGGGAVYLGNNGGVAFSINGFLDGRPIGDLGTDETTVVTIQLGQSVDLEASSAATWRFSVNGGPVLEAGNTATADGTSVTVLPVSPSRVRVTTAPSGAATMPVTLTLTAISTIDSREILTVNMLVR
ncbi:hypothetical protein ACPWT1_21510 [Ramlibacter sp. MMS24-I3-19]|uniref:hypothetical protein n=1 Tax=Ramlibacter sp. MMS24-I3-19 TaxID=3416606 RepID=UPI003D00AB2B